MVTEGLFFICLILPPSPYPMFSLYANWKSNKGLSSTRSWFYALKEQLSPTSNKLLESGELEIVIFPPAPLIYPLHTLCIDTPGVSVGAQDVSPVEEGAHTGLINASSLVGMADAVIVGHVEERKRGDTAEIVHQKYQQALAHKIAPILCVTKREQCIPDAKIISYEPIEAIGSGDNASAQNVALFKSSLSHQPESFIYGGSVNADNCGEYLTPRICDGFLVGTASLDCSDFAALTNTCASYELA